MKLIFWLIEIFNEKLKFQLFFNPNIDLYQGKRQILDYYTKNLIFKVWLFIPPCVLNVPIVHWKSMTEKICHSLKKKLV